MIPYLATNSTSVVDNLTKALSNQATVLVLTSVISPAILISLFYGPTIMDWIRVKGMIKLMRGFATKYDRNVIVMSHREAGLLFGSMITMEDVIQIERLLRKISKVNSNGVDFILNTFGGDLYASMRLALLVKSHPDIRIVVPKYAWSGGSLTAIAGKKILLGKSASLSPVDPQVGMLWKMHSAKDWEEIVKLKGNESDDDSIAMSKMSRQIIEETRRFLERIVDSPSIVKDQFYDHFLTGARTHGDQMYIGDLRLLGLPVEELNDATPDEIIERARPRKTVWGYILKSPRRSLFRRN